MWGEKIKGAGILLVMSKALFYFPARSCLLFYVISKKKKMVLDRCSTIPSLFPAYLFS